MIDRTSEKWTIIYPREDGRDSPFERMNLLLRIARIARLAVQTEYRGVLLKVTPDTPQETFLTIWNEAVKTRKFQGC